VVSTVTLAVLWTTALVHKSTVTQRT